MKLNLYAQIIEYWNGEDVKSIDTWDCVHFLTSLGNHAIVKERIFKENI